MTEPKQQHIMMTSPDFEGAKVWAIGRLEADLSAEYLYHSVAHTRDDVLPAAMRLARFSQLPDDDVTTFGRSSNLSRRGLHCQPPRARTSQYRYCAEHFATIWLSV